MKNGLFQSQTTLANFKRFIGSDCEAIIQLNSKFSVSVVVREKGFNFKPWELEALSLISIDKMEDL